jgi:ABC-type antimicrobial peptide transport system permease subunit
VALGASRGVILGMILRDALIVTFIGAADAAQSKL